MIKPGKALNTVFAEVYDAVGLERGQKGKKADEVAAARAPMFIFTQKKNLFKRISLVKVTFSIAGKGSRGRVAFTLKNVIWDTPFVIFMNIVLPFFL